MPRSAACKGCGNEVKDRGPRAVWCSESCQRFYYQRDWYQRNKGRYRDRYLEKKYNISLADVETLKRVQNFQCAICKVPLEDISDKNTHIDHCHETGRIRGILCINCNTGLGSFYDKPELLEAARRYLENA